MQYLSLVSRGRSHGCDAPGGPGVETQVLQSNPVLESFGNARTVRNDNSSRFGKFVSLGFRADAAPGGPRGQLLGAAVDVYLLEKVRLVAVNPGERTYHAFYEVLAPGNGLGVPDRRRYMLTAGFGSSRAPLTARDFRMTSMSGTFERRDGVDDAQSYRELRAAMDDVGFTADEGDGMFALVAALLHASNLQFAQDGTDDAGVLRDEDGTSRAVASLLGVSEDALRGALTASVLEARGELLVKRLSARQAEQALEATVKAVYAALFASIVQRINKSIAVGGESRSEASRTNPGSPYLASIGVLDIFGFESFHTNSFEQLCINYCNETLQQQFNRFVFKAEQAEYEREGIAWSDIEFLDNQETLDLIEGKRTGIFAVLNEQCRLPKRTDQTFAKAMYDACGSNGYFSATPMQRTQGKFAVGHYAGQVEYVSDGFIVKNKDELPKSASDLLASSTIPFISELAGIIGENSSLGPAEEGHVPTTRASSTLTQATVSAQFTSQLRGLRARISTTCPHYSKFKSMFLLMFFTTAPFLTCPSIISHSQSGASNQMINSWQIISMSR